MNERPIWGVSVWGGFICLLFAFASLIHNALAAGGVMLAGAFLLFAWAAWLEHSGN